MFRIAAAVVLVFIVAAGAALVITRQQMKHPWEIPRDLTAEQKAEKSRPLVFLIQRDRVQTPSATVIHKMETELAKRIGRPVQVQIAGDPESTVKALKSGNGDVAVVGSVPFLAARADTEHSFSPIGAAQYDDGRGGVRSTIQSLFVVRADSKIQSLADVKDHATELRIVFTRRGSAGGYVFPRAALVDANVIHPQQDPMDIFAAVTFGGDQAQSLRDLLDGRADIAAVTNFAMEGPTADKYLSAEQRGKLRIIAREDSVPGQMLCVRPNMDAELVSALESAIDSIAKDDSGLMQDAMGVASFTPMSDPGPHLAPTTRAMDRTGLKLESLGN